jgi:outer membrane protein assembly factor BamB
MCSLSSEYGETRQWCGIGWPGQPAVVERDGRTWVVVGAYDGAVHFVDGRTGEPILPPFQTGDLAKGGVTVDPDGYPIVYQGSRDNRFRAIAIDGDTPRELWSMDARALGEHRWNDDWDGAALVLDDHLVVGGENSRFVVAALHRATGPDGAVTVDPEIVANLPGWDQQLLADVGDNRVSLESSVMVLGDVAYVASSGGLVQGWDLSPLRTGSGTIGRVFRFWTGDDTDATIVGDDEGFLYVGVEVDRGTRRAGEVGQLLKLDPRRPDDPVVWSVDVDQGPDSGTWSTPAVTGDLVIWPTRPGTLYGLDRTTGAVRWTVPLAWGTITSPAVVDGILVQADGSGKVRAYELGDGRSQPALLWTVQLPANVEGTPAVWDGRIYVGCRDGFLYAIGGTR